MPLIIQGKTNWKFLLIVVVLAVVIGSGLWILQREQPIYLKTTKLTTVPDDYEQTFSYVLSPNGRHFAYVGEKEGKLFLIFDGEEREIHDGNYISSLVFSPDSQRFAYEIGSGEWEESRITGGLSWVIDGEKQKSYSDLLGRLYFSHDSQHFVYTAEENGKMFVVFDGNKGKAYDYVSVAKFNKDNQYYYAAKEGNNYFVVINQEETFVFNSEDCDKENYFDEECHASFPEELAPVYMSPDGQHFVYIKSEQLYHKDYPQLRIATRNHLFLDGREKVSDGVVVYIYFSPDSKRLAYTAGNSTIIVDDKEITSPYASIDNFTFSPDSQHFSYIARETGKCSIFLNEEEIQNYEEGGINCYSGPVFSPDSQSLAYLFQIKEDGDWKGYLVLYDGKDFKEYGLNKSLYASNIVFSPDSKHFACLGSGEGKNFIILDGKEGQRYDEIFRETIKFSKNSRYFYYGAKNGNELWWIVEELE